MVLVHPETTAFDGARYVVGDRLRAAQRLLARPVGYNLGNVRCTLFLDLDTWRTDRDGEEFVAIAPYLATQPGVWRVIRTERHEEIDGEGESLPGHVRVVFWLAPVDRDTSTVAALQTIEAARATL